MEQSLDNVRILIRDYSNLVNVEQSFDISDIVTE